MSAMAKKTKTSKKHRFKYAEPSVSAAAAAAPVVAAPAPASKVPAAAAPALAEAATVAGRDFSYVGTDLRRVGVLAASLLALELVLWYLFGHTGVGNVVYNLFQV